MAVPARGPDVRDAARAPTTNGASGVPVRQPAPAADPRERPRVAPKREDAAPRTSAPGRPRPTADRATARRGVVGGGASQPWVARRNEAAALCRAGR